MPKTKKGKGIIAKRGLNKQELREYLELVKLCNAQHWKANMITGNTALINNGQETAKTEADIAKLLENSKNNWLSRVLVSCGISIGQAVEINSETGEIKEKTEKTEPIKSPIKVDKENK